MGVQRFIKSAFKASLKTFDAESVTIGGVDIQAVIDTNNSSNSLGLGAVDNERTLVVQFPADFTGELKSGMIAVARGEKWQISSEAGSIQRGQAAITVTLVEPERRRGD